MSLLEQTDDPVVDPNKDYFIEYVGEGKKYKTEQDLAKAYFHAESALRNREQRLDEMRQDYLKLREDNNSKASLQEMLDQYAKQQHASNIEPLVKDVEPKQIDIKSLLAEELPTHLKAYEAQRKQEENYNLVKAKLKERFGNNYRSTVQEQIEALGISEEDLNTLARKSPPLLFKALGMDAQSTVTDTAPPRSNNTFRPKVESKHKPMSYYQELRKQKPKIYYDPAIAKQMDIDCQALGEAFFDTD